MHFESSLNFSEKLDSNRAQDDTVNRSKHSIRNFETCAASFVQFGSTATCPINILVLLEKTFVSSKYKKIV